MTAPPRNLPGIDLPRRISDYAGPDLKTRSLADAIDQNFREVLTRAHQQITTTQVIQTKVVALETTPPLHAPTHGQNGTDPVAIDWAQIVSGKPTTLAGYGISDAYTKTEADARYAPLAHTHHLSDLLDFGADGGYVRSNGSAWVRVSGVAWADVTGAPAFTTTLAALTDVALTSLADGDLLQYDSGSSKWKNRTVTAALAAWPGSSAITTVGTLSAGAVPYSLLTGSVPTWNQNTTGSAAKLTTARTIGGVNFDGTANITVATATAGFTVSGGDLALGANNLTMTGSLGVTGSRVTKGWFTDLEVTNGIVGSITGNAATATSAAKWTTARNLAGNSVDGSANVAFANKFIVQGTADSGLSAAQFLGALGTGIVLNTTTTGVLSIAVAGDFPTLNQDTTGTAAKATILANARTIGGVSFDGSGNITVASATGGFAVTGALSFTTDLISTTALATPAAVSATQFTAFASAVSGAAVMGFGTTYDAALMNRAGTVALGVTANTADVVMTGKLTVGGTAPSAAGKISAGDRYSINGKDVMDGTATANTLYFGGLDAYFTKFIIRANNANALQLDQGTALFSTVNGYSIALQATTRLYYDGGGDSYSIESSANVIQHYAGGALMLTYNATQMGFFGNALASRQTYTVTNPTTNRSLNVTGATLAQLAQVVGTLVSDLQGLGLMA